MSPSRTASVRHIKGRLVAAALCLGAVGALAACATAPNPYNLTSAQLGQVDSICRSTLGTDPSDPHFGICVESLSTQLDQRNQVTRLAQADSGCRKDGASAGANLALCVLDRSSPAVTLVSTKPLYRVSDAEVLRRQQLSCAKIGLSPATDASAFNACVQQMQDGFYKLAEPIAN